MELEKIQSLYEDCRKILLNTEPIFCQLERVENLKLKDKLKDLFRTVQNDLMFLTNLLYELMNCETESDHEFLLEQTDLEGEKWKAG